MQEFVGYKDPIGDGLYNMGLTDEEVIRCRDCKYMVRAIKFSAGFGCSESRIEFLFCEVHRSATLEGDFCSYARRRP